MNEVAAARGRALLALGRAKEAERHLRTALAADPGDATLMVSLADALLRQQKYSPAVATSRKALAADPEQVDAYATLAAAQAGLDRTEEALRTLDQGLRLAPGFAGMHLQYAAVLLARKQYDDALVSIDRAGHLAPNSSPVAALRAAALGELRRFDEADAAVAEALRLDPENGEAHRIHGWLSLRRGGGSSAVRSHRTALRLDPTDEHSRTGLYFALKTRNPLYGLLFRFNIWLNSVPNGVRLAVLLVPLILIIVLRRHDDQLWTRISIGVVATLTLSTWLLEPLMNAVLLFGRDRNLLSRDAVQATYAFLFFASAAVACAGFGLITGPALLLPLAFGLGVWAAAAGTTHLLTSGRRKVVRIGVLVGVWWCAAATTAVIAGVPSAATTVSVVVFGGVAALLPSRGVAALWVIVVVS